MKEVLVLGAGTGGSLIANKLARVLPDSWRVTVVDRDDDHIYQPGLLFVPFGDLRPDELIRPRMRILDPAVRTVLGQIDRIDPEAKTVALEDGTRLGWDVLILATGTVTRPEETPGMTGRLWREDVHEFYTLEGSTALAERLERFEGGKLAVNLVDMPIKCPVAPLEFTFLVDAYLQKRGLRDKTELVYVTPLDGAFTKPVAARALGGMLEKRGIHSETNFALAEVDSVQKVLRSYDGREVDFDLAVTIPLHAGSKVIRDSEMGDEMGFVPTDHHTLQNRSYDHIFAIGDCTDLPISKAGAVAHFQGDVLLGNVLRYIAGRPLEPDFDGHANCFIETGHNKAMLIDFNYETEPLPGKFPLPGIGPFSLLQESEINHLGKLAFKWVYWNLLVKGEDLPMDHRMLMFGKRSA